MADIVKIDPAQIHIELVKHAVVAGAQLEFRPALQPLVREGVQPRAQLINFLLHGLANRSQQRVEGFGKSGRPDLERGGHGLFRLARRVGTGGNLAAGLVEFGLHGLGQIKLVFQKIINPRADFFNFSA